MKIKTTPLLIFSFLVWMFSLAEAQAQSMVHPFTYNSSDYDLLLSAEGNGRKFNLTLTKNTVVGTTSIPPKQSQEALPRFFKKEDFVSRALFLLREFEGKPQITSDSAKVRGVLEIAYARIVEELNDPRSNLARAVDNLDAVDEQSVAGVVTLVETKVPLKEQATQERKWFKFRGEKVNSYNPSADTYLVDKVSVSFANTLIHNITIDGTINNKRVVLNPESYALSVSSLNLNNETVTFQHEAKTYQLNYSDVIRVFPNAETGFLKKNVADSELWLTPTQKSKPVLSRGFSDYVSAIIFSDLAGVEDESPNGLLQTEVKGYLPLSSKSSYFKGKVRLFSQIEPHINISKIGGKNYFVETGAINSDRDSMFVNHFDLLRYNNLNFGLKLRLLWWVLPSLSSEIAINGSLNGFRTGLEQRYLDANTNKDEFREFNVFSYAPEISGSFILKPDNWIGISFTEGVSKLILLDADVKSSFGDISRVRENNFKPETTDHFFNERFFHFTDVTAFILPSQTKKGGVFVRTRFFKNFSTTNNFYQFQVGYSTDVRNFVNTKK